MNPISKRIVLRATLVCAALATFAAVFAQVPARLVPPAGNVEVMRAYARGVQMYVSVENPNLPGTYVWKFVAPVAILANNGGRDFGTHYAGPTWQADNTGSSVKGTRVDGLRVDPTAIDWLLLSGRDHAGKGMFSKISYIQRIDTAGGLAPSYAPTSAGIEVSIPYTATYVFFESVAPRP
jgi:hypothetical protein